MAINVHTSGRFGRAATETDVVRAGVAIEARVVAGRYQLLSRIGAGGMAEVYLGRDLLLEREVAVKLLHPALHTDAQAVERFRREGLALASVRSPHVLEVLDLGLAGDMFLVLHYVPGRTAAALVIEQGALPVQRSGHLVAQVLAGLAALHERRLVHRDLNPANVIVGWDDHVVIIDLGVVFDPRRPALTPATTTAGTLDFMAPEQRVSRLVDHRSDLYQAGLLLLVLLTGQDVAGIHNGVTGAVMELLTRIPEPIAEVIRCALSGSPLERFSCAESMRGALARAIPACAVATPAEPDDVVDHRVAVSRTTTARQRPLRAAELAAIADAAEVEAAERAGSE